MKIIQKPDYELHRPADDDRLTMRIIIAIGFFAFLVISAIYFLMGPSPIEPTALLSTRALPLLRL